MAITAQSGVIGWSPKVKKGTDAALPKWYKHKAMNVDLDVVDDSRLGPLEIGASPFPTFPYKAGYVVSGGFTIQPRLQDTLAWLLYGMLGDLTTTGTTPAYTHTFKPLSTDLSAVKWLNFRKLIPKGATGDSAESKLGGVYKDCKIIGLTLGLPNDGPITARFDVLGCDFALADDADIDAPDPAWNWENANYEDWKTVPVGCVTNGYIKTKETGSLAESLAIVGAQISFANVPLDLRQEKVFGDPKIDDVTIVERRAMFDIVCKWKDPQLYRKILTGDKAAVDAWTPEPWVDELEVYTIATDPNGVDTGIPYSMKINAPSVLFSLNGPVQLAAGQAVMARFTGTVLEPSTGDFMTVAVKNKIASYTWPVA